jgi:signal transduction histidine kinase/CheY-like chemotaxis protein
MLAVKTETKHNMTHNPNEFNTDTTLNHQKFEKLKDWFASVGYAYFPAFVMLIFFIIVTLSGVSYTITLMVGMSVVLMALYGFTRIQKNRLNINLEKVFSVPAFIVLPSGEIKSSNQLGAELVLMYHGYLKDLLLADGFDNGAAYRLLNVTEVHTERNNHFIYKSRPLHNATILVVRYEQSLKYQRLHPEPQTDAIENITSHFDNLPIGYFEKHHGTSSEQSNDMTEILAMNKTLRDWVAKDSELLKYLQKFGSSDSKRSLGFSPSERQSRHIYKTHENNEFLKIFQFLVNKNTADEKLQCFIVPLDHDSNHDMIEDEEIIAIDDEMTLDEDLSRKIFQNIPISTVILNQEDMIIDYNQAFLDLLDISELTHFSIRDYFPEGERPKFNTNTDNTSIEMMMTTPKERILNLKICFSDDKNYKICYLSDVSTEKSLEQKFNQAQKMQAIGQLAGGVAHDFNNLLTAILGHTELLMNRFNPSDSVYADLMHIRNNSNRAGNLVRQLLAFSRRQTLKPEIIILTDILPDISRMLERLVGDRISLITNYAPSLKPIKADITQLEQVIINLGVNARDAMEENGGTLTITTENLSMIQSSIEGHNIMPAADYVKMTVSDTGHGMSDDICTKIFEPFFTTKEQGKGTGLGLSTVYGIVKQSGGFIFVDSKPNQGTHFRIYFPTTLEQKTLPLDTIQDNSEIDSDIALQAPHTKTILVVEDEESVRSFVVRALELRGYNVLQADCGEDALTLFNTYGDTINLVITDVMMPGLSGPEWIKEAQKIRNNFKVIFMSGYTQDYLRDDDAFKLSDLDITFLSKPFSLKGLNELVQKKL